MILTPTICFYIAKYFLRNFFVLVAALLFVVYIFDTVELIRRAGKFDDVPFSLILQMSILKLPEVGQIILPFSILFSAMRAACARCGARALLTIKRHPTLMSVWVDLVKIIK